MLIEDVDNMSLVTTLLEQCGIQATLAQGDDFQKWLINEAWNKYKDNRMNKRIVIENQVKDLNIKLSNGTVRKDYTACFSLPKDVVTDFWLDGCDQLGLKCNVSEENECTISGKPTQPGDFKLKLSYKYDGMIDGEEPLSIELPIAFNPDPRSLWKDIPTDKNVIFYKDDCTCEYVKVEEKEETGPRKDIVAASQRGRSHAQEGKARDDHFKLYHCNGSDWYIIAVADGAGSAKYSRKGSEIACNTVVDFCKEKLLHSDEFEEQIVAYKNAEDEETARKQMSNTIYSIIGNAAFKAHKAINDASKDNEGTKPKDFATTLMFAICKKFEFGWFVASYWVGDGAMAIYNEEKNTVRLLGVPDEGEYSGQTRFLTMPEIFKDASAVFERLRFSIEDDFTALILMTDGVSDPMFETENNLNDVEKWKELWEKLEAGCPDDGISGVDFSDDNEESKNQLLGWLDFWSAGNHDDR